MEKEYCLITDTITEELLKEKNFKYMATELFDAIATTSGQLITDMFPLFILLISGLAVLVGVGAIIYGLISGAGKVLK